MSARGSIKLENSIKIGAAFNLEGGRLEALLEWRPRPGEAFTVSSPNGALFRARLIELHEGSAILMPFEQMGMAEAAPEIILMQALPERERMETIIQKTTELGITSILPFKSEKSISLEELDSRQKRSHNWGEVAMKAARQSRRPDIPEVLPYSFFEEALARTENFGLKVMLWEGAQTGLKELLVQTRRPISSAALLVGPEGGFTKIEIEAALDKGFSAVNLGLRVLRTETAAIFGAGLLRYELGG
ncbi:MAG: RNA methyltransferase [Deltaproteobacteria bacterium]|nr:RNA methyltransferase [Deltaproteobacteria bacterium]